MDNYLSATGVQNNTSPHMKLVKTIDYFIIYEDFIHKNIVKHFNITICIGPTRN